MKELLSLRHWALSIIVLPTIIIGLLLGGYLTFKRYTELDDNLIDRGVFLAEPLAMISAQTMMNSGAAEVLDRNGLKAVLEMAHRRASPIVRSISVFTIDHQLYLSTNRHVDFDNIGLKPGVLIPEHTMQTVEDGQIYIRTPILGPSSSTESYSYIRNDDNTLYGYLVVELSRDQALLDQQSSLLALMGMMLTAILFTTLFAITFIRNIIGPIDRMSHTIQDIKNGKTKTKLNEPMLGELDRLRTGINNIGRAIYDANERAELNISEYTQELQQTVEQLEVQNIQLNLARRDAQEANDVKSQFLANMSHELRTPLNGVLGFTRQLKKTSLNVNQRDFLETIESSAQNLLRIINDILDFSKLEAGKMELEDIPFALRDSLNEVMTLLAPNIFDKGLDIHMHVDANVPDELRGDPDRLKQVIVNLIGNAIKFTNSGYIRLDVKYLRSVDQGHQLKFIITDTGVGIDDEGRHKLFAAFGQADSSVTRKYGGTGLGLIICKKLVEAMNGKIHFDSELGKGSRFYFDAYLEENHLNVAQALPTKVLKDKRVLYLDGNSQSLADTCALINYHTDVKLSYCDSEQKFAQALEEQTFDIVLISRNVSPGTVGELKQLISIAKSRCEYIYTAINSISPNLKEAFVGSGARVCLSLPMNHRKLINALASPYLAVVEQRNDRLFDGLKVLAVDDHEPNLKLLSALLSEQGILVDSAENGKQGLQLAQKHTYDVIFMDIQMPVMDGITACKEIKESSLNETTPIISVTAHAAPEERQNMMDVGFTDFLAKPIDEDMLKQILLEVQPTPSNKSSSAAINNNDKEQAITVPSESLPDFASHPQVDWPLALKRAAGKQDLALEMFSMLIKSVPGTLEQTREFMAQDDTSELQKVIHKFHGACCYTGVPNIKRLAETIEAGLKQTTSISTVEPELLELMDQLEEIDKDSKNWAISA